MTGNFTRNKTYVTSWPFGIEMASKFDN